ncbi:MAG: ribonuclease R [Planctomycetia bacterium]|nr:ribonuclease R [Planctomycetia bacterium]RLT12362.1 MAG: ribonuclease R [Planctomycetota bacterium]
MARDQGESRRRADRRKTGNQKAKKQKTGQQSLVGPSHPSVGKKAVRPQPVAEPSSTPGSGNRLAKRPSSRPSDQDVSGIFRRAAGGYGFVRPLDASAGDRSGDLHIASHASLDAASGDTVRVRVSRSRDVRRPGPSGEIVEILLRRTSRFVGTFFEAAGSGWVRIDGTSFTRPVAVGDPGAKGAREQDKIVVEMVRFPTHLRDGEGVVVEVLGRSGDPGVDTQTVIHEFNLPGPFSDEVLADARRQAEHFSEEVPADRIDLTNRVVITIDPIDARDFDDAISLEPIERGHWLLGVHIADVSHFVPEGSPLDQEALARGTSVYLPDRVIPMLPEIVSNNLASLQPGRVRYARTCWMEFSAEGIPVHSSVESTAIKSARRLTYEEVDVFLADPATREVELTADVRSLLGRMRDVSRMLRARRRARGALELTMPEVKIDLDRDGRVQGAHVVQNTESHKIIEEFMLSANEAVASALAAAGAGFLRRIHPSPDPRKLRQLTEFVSELGFEVDTLESRFEVQRLLKLAHGRPEEHAVHYAVLRSLTRAAYGPQEDGHFALASECYCHFTSPIRRYPDLTIHRALAALAKGRRVPADGLVQLGAECSQLERRAESAERELVKLKLFIFMSSRIGHEMDAVVTGVESFGLFVQGLQLPAEGLVTLAALPDDTYRHERASHTLCGRRPGHSFRLGDRVRVVVARVDLDRRTLDFRLIETGQERSVRPPSARSKSRPPVESKRKQPKKSSGERGQKKSKRLKR